MLTLNDGSTKLEEHLNETGRSKYTIISYINDVKQLNKYLSQKNIEYLDNVKPSDLEEYKQDMLKNPLFSTKSVSRKINTVRLLFRFLYQMGYLKENLAKDLTHPKFKTTPPRVLSQTEYMAIRDASRSDNRLYSIVEILLQTGIRVGELVRLKINDLIEKDGKFYLNIEPFESQSGRTVLLNTKAYQALQKWLSVRPNVNSDFIYVTRNSKPIIVRNLRSSLLRVFKRADVKDATVNEFRNTFIAYYLSKGVPKDVIAKMVGHKNLTTVDRYKELLNNKSEKIEDFELVL